MTIKKNLAPRSTNRDPARDGKPGRAARPKALCLLGKVRILDGEALRWVAGGAYFNGSPGQNG